MEKLCTIHRPSKLVKIALIMLLLAGGLASTKVTAQANINAGEDPEKAASRKHIENAIVMIQQKDPQNIHVLNANRYSQILQHADQSDADNAEKDIIKQRLQTHMNAIEQIVLYMDQGDSYEKAMLRLERKKQADQKNATNQKSNLSGNAPVFSPATN